MNPNSAYWKTREERQKRLYQISEEEYQAKVKDIYDNMVVSINKEVYGFYGKYAKTEGITIEEARQRVSKIDMAEYEAKAKKYVKERDFSDQANEELRLYNTSMKINRLELLKANIGLEMVDGFDQLQKEFDADLTERAYAELKRQAGILGKSVDNTAKTAGSIVNASFKNATFSDRIWMYQAMMKDRLSTLLTQGMVQGKSPILLARDLTKAFGVSRSDAERLMRTELARVQISAQEEAYKQNGYDFYEFIGGQADACPICSALDGKRFAVKDMMPGTNAPPMHPNCRCSTAAFAGSKLSYANITKTIDSGTDKRYSISPEKKLTKETEKDKLREIYDKAVADGWISALSGFENYENIHSKIQDEIVGKTSSGGIKITASSNHFMERVIGTSVDPKILKEDLRIVRRSGVEFSDIKDAALKGKTRAIKTDSQGRRSQVHYNDKCVVSIDPDTGVLIQCNPLRG